MTRGVLLFAHNNEQVNYGIMAYWCARRIAEHLAVPVSLVSDANTAKSLDHHSPDWRQAFDHGQRTNGLLRSHRHPRLEIKYLLGER
jgi:hypothetical protein